MSSCTQLFEVITKTSSKHMTNLECMTYIADRNV